MNYKREFMYHPYVNDNGFNRTVKVEYTLWFQDNQLLEVRNEYGYCVEYESGCWEYFNKKYNTHGD